MLLFALSTGAIINAVLLTRPYHYHLFYDKQSTNMQSRCVGHTSLFPSSHEPVHANLPGWPVPYRDRIITSSGVGNKNVFPN